MTFMDKLFGALMDRLESERAGKERKTREFVKTTPYGSIENWEAQLTPKERTELTPMGANVAKKTANKIDEFANKIVEIKNKITK